MMETHIVVMAGGIGSRLFPLSTPERPKQFLDLLGCGRTLLQLTFDRFLKVAPDAVFWVVTSSGYVHFVREQLPGLAPDHILAEPAARSTAPCIAYACRKIYMKSPNANVIVTPADAYVPDTAGFAQTLRRALEVTARSEKVVCIGIAPTEPHTGYGYIHAPQARPSEAVKVLSFKEKPSLELAKTYLAEGSYFWNAGIFVWSAGTIEAELRLHAPQISSVMDALTPSLYTDGEREALESLFPTCEKISIDYAVMEKSSNVYVIPGEWEWSDLGSFESVEKHRIKQI